MNLLTPQITRAVAIKEINILSSLQAFSNLVHIKQFFLNSAHVPFALYLKELISFRLKLCMILYNIVDYFQVGLVRIFVFNGNMMKKKKTYKVIYGNLDV